MKRPSCYSIRGAVCALVLFAIGSGVTARATGNIWYDKFVAWESVHGSDFYNSTNSATLAWGESYLLRSYVTLYQLTGSTAWLDKFVTHADTMIANATDSDGDGFLDWKTADYGDGGSYPYVVHDGLIGLAFAQFVKLVHENSTTLSAYVAKKDSYKTFVESEIVAKWATAGSYITTATYVSASSTEAYYKEPTFAGGGDSLPGGNYTPLPYNQYLAFAEMLLTMYDVNANASYLDHGKKCAQYWNSRLLTNGTGYSWRYSNSVTTAIEDTSHANLDVETAIEAYHRGQIFDGSEMAKLFYTLKDNMWNGSLTAPKLSDRVDGTGTVYDKTLLMSGWTRLAEFGNTAWLIAANQYRSISPTLFNHAFVLTQIMAWDPVKIVGQGFEYGTFNDATLPARWTRGGGTSTNIRRYTADKFSGAASAAITSVAGDTGWKMLYQDWSEWAPNTTYVVTFNVKTFGGTAGARIFMYNVTNSTVVGAVHDYDSPSWSTQTFTFTTPATGPALRLYLENHTYSVDGTALFDNVVIKQSGDTW